MANFTTIEEYRAQRITLEAKYRETARLYGTRKAADGYTGASYDPSDPLLQRRGTSNYGTWGDPDPLKLLPGIHPVMRSYVVGLCAWISKDEWFKTIGWRPFVHYGYRTPAESAVLEAKGTGAGAWLSLHNYGLAVDLHWWFPDGTKGWPKGVFNNSFTPSGNVNSLWHPAWYELGRCVLEFAAAYAIARHHGQFVWGGTFTSRPDGPHVELWGNLGTNSGRVLITKLQSLGMDMSAFHSAIGLGPSDATTCKVGRGSLGYTNDSQLAPPGVKDSSAPTRNPALR